MRDHHRRARELGAFLPSVDVGVALPGEHALQGREAAQRRAFHHQAEAGWLAGRDRVQRHGGDQRIQRRCRDFTALHVVQRARWPRRRCRRSIRAPGASPSVDGSAARSCIDGSRANRSALRAATVAASSNGVFAAGWRRIQKPGSSCASPTPGTPSVACGIASFAGLATTRAGAARGERDQRKRGGQRREPQWLGEGWNPRGRSRCGPKSLGVHRASHPFIGCIVTA